MYYFEGFGEPVLEGDSCSNRACDTSYGKLREEIQIYDEKEYKLSYEVVEGFPFFIAKGVNNWRLTSLSDDKTKVSMRFEGQTTGLMGVIMGTIMKIQLGGGLQNAVEEFKHYIETGNLHPRKVRDMKKHHKKMKITA